MKIKEILVLFVIWLVLLVDEVEYNRLERRRVIFDIRISFFYIIYIKICI